jgi:hypothetical protein
MFQSGRLSKKICGQGQKNVFGRTFPTNLPKFILIIYGPLKMSQGQLLPDPDPELVNAKSLHFVKPKLFFKTLDVTLQLLPTFMSGYLSIFPKFWTQSQQSSSNTRYSLTNTKTLSKPSPKQPQT